MTLIFLFIIPLCNKYKATIGQLILKLSVVDKYYVYAGWSFLLLRYLAKAGKSSLAQFLILYLSISISLSNSFTIINLLHEIYCDYGKHHAKSNFLLHVVAVLSD